MPRLPVLATVFCCALACLPAHAQIKRTVDPASTLPFASTVVLPPDTHMVFVAGTLADVANPDAPKGSFEAYGNTETQTASTLRKIEKLLAAEGFTLGDVVKVSVFLVGDPKLENKMDFTGMNTAYRQFFGSAAQPNKAARTTIMVPALPMPGGLVEIDVVAARVGPPPMKK